MSVLTSCGEQQENPTDIAEVFTKTFEREFSSFTLIDRHGSQQWTGDLQSLYSYPSNTNPLFVKYVVGEDLYDNLEKGDVVLLPICLSLSKTDYGAASNASNIAMPSSQNSPPSQSVTDSSSEAFVTASLEIAHLLFKLLGLS